MTEKNQDAVRLGRAGGLARKRAMTSEQRTEAARRAAQIRWAQHNAETKSDIIEGESDRK